MTDREPNKPKGDQAPVSEGVSSEIESMRTGRRQFIKKTIVTVPVILTVTSRPVWARNCTWSGQLSGNLSDAGPPCGGEGCPASYWQDHPDRWHYEFCDHKSFFEVFKVDAFPNATLYDVILARPNLPVNRQDAACNNKQALRNFGRECVTALQNSATRVSFEWTVCDIIDHFSEGYYYYNCTDLRTATNNLMQENSRGSTYCE